MRETYSGPIAPLNEPGPCAPRQQHQRVGAIAAEEERIVFAEPFLELREAAAVFARLHLGNDRCFFATMHIQINVMPGAAEAAGAGSTFSSQRLAIEWSFQVRA